MPPIYANSTYIQESPGVYKGFDYGRSYNPTRWALERCVADFEGGIRTSAFAPGLTATSSILELLDAGPRIVSGNDLYDGILRLFEWVRWHSAGHRFNFIDPTDLQVFKAAPTPGTRMTRVETPNNPLLRLTDLRATAQFCCVRNIISATDNTLASPYIQRPPELGFDVVVHSTTKYLNGHSDMIGGITTVGNNPDPRECLGPLQNSAGTISGPFDALLTLCGVETLALRIERHCSNALILAQWLEYQPQVARVYYSGLASHPQHEPAKWQIRSFGGMISLDLRCDLVGARCFPKSVRVLPLVENLGEVESPVEHLTITTHASIPTGARADLGIGDSLTHLSVGVKVLEDLQTDLAQTLTRI